MANYVVTKVTYPTGSSATTIEGILASMETYIETRDSTTNPIFLMDIIQQKGGTDLVTKYTGVILTKGA
jgi:hypothetical protein